MVLSRATAFEFKESRSSPDQIAARLGVKAALSGSVRKAGKRIRVSAQLQEARSGKTLWSHTYDRTVDDIFDVQDELTREIVTALDVELVHGEHARLAGFRLHSSEAAEQLYRGIHELYRYEHSTMISARRHFERFVELEPDSVLGYSWLSYAWTAAMLVQWAPAEVAVPKLREFALKALAIDPDDVSALISNAYYNLAIGDLDAAWQSANQAVENAPNSDEAVFVRGFVENFLGWIEKAQISLERSMRLCPIPGSTRLGVAATIYRNAGRFEDSIKTWKHLIARYPDFLFGYSGLASTYAVSGQIEEARDMVGQVLAKDPDYTIQRFTNPDFYRDPNVMRQCAAALEKAGMPT